MHVFPDQDQRSQFCAEANVILHRVQNARLQRFG